MKKLCIVLLCLILPCLTFAQKSKKVNYQFSSLNQIQVNGNVDDWEGQLNYMNGDVWAFGIGEQNNDLFVAIVIKDPQLRQEALRGGLFVNISYNDKKSEGARLQYPYWDRERRRALANNEEIRENFAQEILKQVSGYFLSGFGKVRDGVLALENDYNIEAKVQMDRDDILYYEARIPLDLVGVKGNTVAVNLGINTNYALAKRAADQANKRRNATVMYPMIGRPMVQSSIKNPYKVDTEVWVIDRIGK